MTAQLAKAETVIRGSMRRHGIVGLALIALVFGAAGGWAATTDFNGAVIARGALVVETNNKKVQHPSGGIVSDIRVRNGSRVSAGDLLLRLDDVQLRTNLAVIVTSIDESVGRLARAEAERSDAAAIVFPDDLVTRRHVPHVAKIIADETSLFEAKRSGRMARKAQLQSRITQLEDEITSLQARTAAKEREIGWIKQELGGVRQLWEQRLIQITRLSALEREAAKLDGDVAGFAGGIAQARERIAEARQQLLQIDEDTRSEAGKDVAELRLKLGELVEKRTAAADQLQRTEIRAPRDGIVHELEAHTIGGVVAPGATVMTIVPYPETLKVDARVQPADIDQIAVGHAATVRFEAFNQTITPEVNGVVSMVAPDVSIDKENAQGYYTVRVDLPPEEVARLRPRVLFPGMPVDVFVQTTPRTVLSFLSRPLENRILRSFRER